MNNRVHCAQDLESIKKPRRNYKLKAYTSAERNVIGQIRIFASLTRRNCKIRLMISFIALVLFHIYLNLINFTWAGIVIFQELRS